MITCNNCGNCSFKILANVILSECTYVGYCDYQAPKDSRMQPLTPLPPYVPECTCGSGSSLSCPLHCPNG